MIRALAALTALLAATAAAETTESPAAGCPLAAGGSFEARLGGAIETELRWAGAHLECSGMLRPGGAGFRLRFAGPLPGGGRLALVFAPPALGGGDSGRGVPVNVTVLDEASGRIFGTRGAGRCTLDEILQAPLAPPAPGARAWRVEGRGFCTEPARALDDAGSVLLTRFDFAGRLDVSAAEARERPELPPEAEPLERFPEAWVTVATRGGEHRFDVWVADTPARQQQGLMYVRELPPGRGMLFPLGTPRYASFWMRNTFMPLDLVFIGPGGRVVNVIESAEPLSLRALESRAPAIAVLELAGGTARRLGLRAGDRVRLPNAPEIPGSP